MIGRTDPDSHPQAAITGLPQALIDATRVAVTETAVSISVAVNQPQAQWIAVTANLVVITVPAGLAVGEQFSVTGRSDTTFAVDASYTLEMPATKLLQPFEDGSSLTFTNTTNFLIVTGDMADV